MSAPAAAAAPARAHTWALAVGWLAYFAALQWSVVRFKVPIVVILVGSALALAAWQWRRADVRLAPRPFALMMAGSAVAAAAVPLFSYLEGPGLAAARVLLVVTPVVVAALMWPGRERGSRLAATVAVGAYLMVGVLAIRTDPTPEIDVWVMLQQASDALARGVNFYAISWVGSPGVPDAFTYLPWTAVLLAPGRWLLGDVRWALLGWTVVAAVGIWLLATRARWEVPGGGAADADAGGLGARWRAAALVSLLLLAPGTLTQVDQAWTEPLLLAGLVWWLVLVDRDRAWWAVIPLALACASKQHLVLLLPVLALWRPFGLRRTLATGALAALLVAPWFVAGPADFWHDTVALLVSFHAILFANTLYLLVLNVAGYALPFWVTGLVVAGTLAGIMAVVGRRQPDPGELVRWLALLLLVANLVNKQAFYNQYWLVGSLVVTSLAVAAPAMPTRSRSQEREGVVGPLS